jgi:hypothetical protein
MIGVGSRFEAALLYEYIDATSVSVEKRGSLLRIAGA